MRQLSLDEVKKLEFDMLVHFDKVCRANNIKYSLAYGTLIGAIRHKGFIPWDDDIDIIMSRDEYDKFLSVWEDGAYKLLTLKKGCDFWPLFSRITDPRTHLDPPSILNHGVWVAVIPYDRIPDNKFKCKWYLRRVKISLGLFALRRTEVKPNSIKNICKRSLKLILTPFSLYLLGKHVERIKVKYRNSNYKRINPWKDNIYVDADIFNDYLDVEFEGLKAMAMKKYDYFLRYLYGDYMQLPPENERVPIHGFTAYIDE